MFGTSGIRGRVGEVVTAELALSVGRALSSAGYERVVVGRDVRAHGGMLVDALAAGVRECGGDVVDVGVAATPTVARSVGWQDADAGAVVTASHNPPADNGIKLWSPSGQAFDSAARAEIETRLEAGAEGFERADWDGVGERTRATDFAARHARAIREAVLTDERTDAAALGDLSVVVDVGNGAGSVTAEVLVGLGCHVRTLNAQPDGRFPARPSEPTAETLETLRAVVAGTDAALGVAHDGDADRMVAVDERGEFVPPDALLAVLAREAVLAATGGERAAGARDGGDGSVDDGAGEDVASDGGGEAGDDAVRVAAPLNTSLAVDDALAPLGATVTRTPVGDVHVAERATESDVVFGGEPSGAWIWPAETLCPDGPLAACKLAALVAGRGSLADLVEEIDTYPIRREAIPVADRAAVMEAVIDRVRERGEAFDATDGVRIESDEGWTLIRPSGTEPVVRVTAEARTAERADASFDDARSLVRGAADTVD